MKRNASEVKIPLSVLSLFVADEIIVAELISISDHLGLEIRHATAGDPHESIALVYHFVESEDDGEYKVNMMLDRLFEKTLRIWNTRAGKSSGV